MDKVICVGKNYRGHAEELGEKQPDFPVIFLKPASVVKQAHQWQQCLDVHFPADSTVVAECELVIQIAKDGDNIAVTQATPFIAAVSVGLDMTLRQRQSQLKKQGHPWTTAKVFPDAAILAPWIAVEQIPNWLEAPFGSKLNGDIAQQSTAKNMYFQPAALIAYISRFFPLCQGDIIFTGTPLGCPTIKKNETLDLFFADQEISVQWNR